MGVAVKLAHHSQKPTRSQTKFLNHKNVFESVTQTTTRAAAYMAEVTRAFTTALLMVVCTIVMHASVGEAKNLIVRPKESGATSKFTAHPHDVRNLMHICYVVGKKGCTVVDCVAQMPANTYCSPYVCTNEANSPLVMQFDVTEFR